MADLSKITLPNNTTVTLKDTLGRKEAYLEWGGKNFTGAYGCLDAAMVSNLNANRFSFLKPAGVTIEYTRDGGTTWTDYGVSDEVKSGIFDPGNSLIIGKADSTNKATANGTKYQLRITINTATASIYTGLQKIVIFCSTNGSADCKCQISGTLKPSTSYTNITDPISIGGWSGYNVIQVGFTAGNSFDGQYNNIRFLFTANGGNTTYTGLTILQIMGFGGMGWTTPSTMAKNGHLYSYDGLQNATFPATVTATKFIGPLQGNADTATSAGSTQKLATLGRLTTPNTQYGDGAMRYTIVSSSMTTDKPNNADGHLINLPWDNSGGYDSEIYIQNNGAGLMWIRGQSAGTWKDWKQVGVFTATPTSGQVVITDGTTGGIKSSGYTIATSVPSSAVFTDQYVSQSSTTTSDWRKIVLSYQNNSTAGTAVTAYTNVTYVTPNAEVQPSTGSIRSAGNIVGNVLGISATNGTSGGISLYSGAGSIDTYGIAFRFTTNQGKHGYVQGDWATYFTMSNSNSRGWVFKRNSVGGVASISTDGDAVFNGSVTIGGNTTNTSGAKMQYNTTTQAIDFVFN